MRTLLGLIDDSWLMTFAAVLCVIICAVVFYKIMIRLLHRYDRQRATTKDYRGLTYSRLTASLLRYAIGIVTLFIVLYLLGVNITSMVAGVGLASVIVSFAVQDIVKDMVSGIGIVGDSYFQVGDVIYYKEQEGEVLSVGLRTTRIRMLVNDNVMSIANRNINEIEVISRKYVQAVPLPYDLSVYQAEKIIKDIVDRIQKNEFVDSCKYVGVTELDSSSIQYKLEIMSDPIYRVQVRRDTLRSILLGMEQNHIQVPYTQIDIHTINDAKRAEEFAAITDDPAFRKYVDKFAYASSDSIFRTEKYRIFYSNNNVEEVLDGAEKFAWRMGCNKKERLQVRLLTEELTQIVRSIVPEAMITVVYKVRGKRCNVRAQISGAVTDDQRDKLLGLSSLENKQEFDIIGLVRSVTARFLVTDVGHEIQTWSLRQYLEEMELTEDIQDDPEYRHAQEEIEKAIISKIADDVQVSFNETEIVIEAFKSF